MVLKLPPLSDELAARVYELVQDFLEQYEHCYQYHIHRFYLERDREQQQLRAQSLFETTQQSPPFEDDPPLRHAMVVTITPTEKYRCLTRDAANVAPLLFLSPRTSR